MNCRSGDENTDSINFSTLLNLDVRSLDDLASFFETVLRNAAYASGELPMALERSGSSLFFTSDCRGARNPGIQASGYDVSMRRELQGELESQLAGDEVRAARSVLWHGTRVVPTSLKLP